MATTTALPHAPRATASGGAATARGETLPELLRADVEALTALDRRSASAGERRAAEWIAGRVGELDLPVQLEREPGVSGSYWLPFGLLSLAGVAGGAAALAGRRVAGGALATAAAAGLVDDLSISRRAVRRLVARRETRSVVCRIGPEDARRTVVVTAHYDAAQAGLVFHPGIARGVARRLPRLVERTDTQPPIWWPVAGAPLAAGLGAASGSRRLTAAGTLASALVALALGDIARRPTVAGANDNASGAAVLLQLARLLAARPPRDVRVLLLWTGAEESLLEGIQAFARRHFASMRPDRTFFLCVDTVGCRRLALIRGEGPLRMYDYPRASLRRVEQVADELGIELACGLRARNGTDGLYPLKAGYPCVLLSSIDEHKAQRNYHWPTDRADTVDYSTVADSVGLCEAVVRDLEERWVRSPRGRTAGW